MHFTHMFYANVSRSLFDDDKLPFAIMMMVRFLEVSRPRQYTILDLMESPERLSWCKNAEAGLRAALHSSVCLSVPVQRHAGMLVRE